MFEYAIFHRSAVDPHIEGMTYPVACRWLDEWISEGGSPGTFFIARRTLGPWIQLTAEDALD